MIFSAKFSRIYGSLILVSQMLFAIHRNSVILADVVDLTRNMNAIIVVVCLKGTCLTVVNTLGA